MTFEDKFAQFHLWDLIGWCFVIAAWLVFELWGATHRYDATFTYLLRTTCSSFRYGRLCLTVAWIVLGWHFLWYDTGWWRTLLTWMKGN